MNHRPLAAPASSRLASTMTGDLGHVPAAFHSAPPPLAGAGRIDENERALRVGALADPRPHVAGEKVDGVAGDRGQDSRALTGVRHRRSAPFGASSGHTAPTEVRLPDRSPAIAGVTSRVFGTPAGRRARAQSSPAGSRLAPGIVAAPPVDHGTTIIIHGLSSNKKDGRLERPAVQPLHARLQQSYFPYTP